MIPVPGCQLARHRFHQCKAVDGPAHLIPASSGQGGGIFPSSVTLPVPSARYISSQASHPGTANRSSWTRLHSRCSASACRCRAAALKSRQISRNRCDLTSRTSIPAKVRSPAFCCMFGQSATARRLKRTAAAIAYGCAATVRPARPLCPDRLPARRYCRLRPSTRILIISWRHRCGAGASPPALPVARHVPVVRPAADGGCRFHCGGLTVRRFPLR